MKKFLLTPLVLLGALSNANAQSYVVGSSVPQSAIDEAPSYTTIDAFGNRTTTSVLTPDSVAKTLARQGIYGANQSSSSRNSRRHSAPTIAVPYPVPVHGYVYGAPVYVPYPVPVPQNTIQQVPLGRSNFGWDQPPTITSIPLGTTYNYYPAPVYGQPVYGAPVYGQPYYGAPNYGNYCPPTYGHSYQSGTSFSIGGGGLSFSYSSSSRR